MKKSCLLCIAILAAAAVSCEKLDNVLEDVDHKLNPSVEREPGTHYWWDGLDKAADLSVFGKAPCADAACLVSFNGDPLGVRSVEFTEGGLFVVRFGNGKAVVSGYTFQDGKYKLGDGYGELLMADGKASVRLGAIELSGQAVTVKKPTYHDDLEKAICRSWKGYTWWDYYAADPYNYPSVQSFKGNGFVDFKDVSVYYYYTFGMTSTYFTEGRLLDPDEMDGTKMTGFAMTGNGTIIMTFDGMDPYVGKWSWKDRSLGQITFDLSESNGGNLFIPRKEGEKDLCYVTCHDKYFLFGIHTEFKAGHSIFIKNREGEYSNNLIIKMTE